MPDDDLTPEQEAEIDKALSNAFMPDHESLHAFELIVRGFEAIGAEALKEEHIGRLPDSLEGISPVDMTDQQWDQLRSWIVDAGDSLQEYMKVHGLPYLHIPHIVLSCGCIRSMRLDVGE